MPQHCRLIIPPVIRGQAGLGLRVKRLVVGSGNDRLRFRRAPPTFRGQVACSQCTVIFVALDQKAFDDSTHTWGKKLLGIDVGYC